MRPSPNRDRANDSSDAGGFAAPPGNDPGGGSSRQGLKDRVFSKVRAVLFLGVLLLSLATLPSPRVPTAADQDATADASWCAVLEYAHQHGLQFGTDIIFTYGPLGFLAAPYIFSATVGPRVITDLVLSWLTSLSVCLIARRLGIVWGILLVAMYLFLAANIYPRTDLLLELSLLCWGILCIAATGPNLLIYGLILAGLSIFAGLVKITLLVMAVLTVAAVSLDLLLRNNRRLSLGVAGLSVLGFIVVWVGAGQNLLHLGTFLHRGFITAMGYNNSMAYEGSVVLRGRAILTALLGMATILGTGYSSTRQPGLTKIRHVLQAGWLLGLLFLVWKHGFVRTDLYHAGFFFGFAPILALAWGTLATRNSELGQDSKGSNGTRSVETETGKVLLLRLARFTGNRPWPKAFAVGCSLISLFTIQTMILPGDWKASLQQPFDGLRASISNLARPGSYQEQINAAVSAERERNQLPVLRGLIGQSTVDMFGCEQLALLANNLQYQPRPVFQSYAAYSAPLMEWNERFYGSEAAPKFVIFRLLAMDRKLPTLEDALLLRHLLINYEPVATEGPFLLLALQRTEQPQTRLLQEGTIPTGQSLNLAQYSETNLWLELAFKPTLLGKVRQFVYQPAKIRLVLSGDAAGKEVTRRFRAPAPMLGAGFLLSPLLLQTDDVRSLYNGNRPNRPNACSIEFNPGDEKFWQKTIRFRVYAIENRLGRRETQGP